jgi:hypothetical protein
MSEVGGIIDLDSTLATPELHLDGQPTGLVYVLLPGQESDTESPGSAFYVLKKKHVGSPVELLGKLIDGHADQPPAVKYVEDREGNAARPEGLRLDVPSPVVKPGDLVMYAPPYYDTRSPEAENNNLIGLVVNVKEDVGRARVFWQKYNVYKLVELAHLEILKKKE